MSRSVAIFAAVVLTLSSGLVISQQVTTPEMMLYSFADVEIGTPADGRKVRRISASTVGLIRVEWPEGTATTPHNHANELVLSVVEGRLRAISGDQEFIMEAGDTVVIPAWVEHSYIALEDSITFEAAGPG
ncbi:MAG: cupin domain-containing protein [Candidatus Rariloculaceae bacterium]